MASAKRTVIEISSGSDDDNPLVTRRKIRRRSKVSEPQRREADPEPTQAGPTFAEFLSQALPSKLIAGDVAEYIQRESNIRLKTAREEGIALDGIFIGMDCLPTWIGMQWDPQRESLHCAIQDRLMDLEVSSILGDVLREELIFKGNQRLEEARQHEVGIEDITIGKGLLATWNTLQSSREIFHGLKTPPEEGQTELMYDNVAPSSIETTVTRSSVLSRGETPKPDIIISSATTVQNSPETVYDSSSTYDSCSDFSSSNGSNSSSTDDEEEADDIIHMNNSLNPQPEYLESDDEAPHILHDVEIAGRHGGYPDIDLEVYLVEDDEEVEDLPEMELAIDGDAFTHYFGDDGVMEVEIPGMDLRCSLDIPQDQSDEGGYSSGDGQPLEDIEDDCDDCVMDEDEDGDGEDGEKNSIIQITEDGFVW